jgi:hypothetical protein
MPFNTTFFVNKKRGGYLRSDICWDTDCKDVTIPCKTGYACIGTVRCDHVLEAQSYSFATVSARWKQVVVNIAIQPCQSFWEGALSIHYQVARWAPSGSGCCGDEKCHTPSSPWPCHYARWATLLFVERHLNLHINHRQNLGAHNFILFQTRFRKQYKKANKEMKALFR